MFLGLVAPGFVNNTCASMKQTYRSAQCCGPDKSVNVGTAKECVGGTYTKYRGAKGSRIPMVYVDDTLVTVVNRFKTFLDKDQIEYYKTGIVEFKVLVVLFVRLACVSIQPEGRPGSRF